MRVIIVGGPRTGKSTLAREYRAQGIPTFCGDPRSMVKEPEEGVTYLPDDLDFSGENGGAKWIAFRWFPMVGPWVCEGHVMARALRRWADGIPFDRAPPADKIIVLRKQHDDAVTKPGQVSMHRAVMTVWDEIAWRFAGIVEER